MKTIRFTLSAALAAISMVMGNQLCDAAPLSTAFTYQGRLIDAGTPASGLYDFKFTLHDAAAEGSSAGSPGTVLLAAVPVTNGLFTVNLDFGLAGFEGADRWLQINTKTNGAGLYTSLSPRQPLTPTPYALYAPNAGKAAIASSVPWNSITGIPAGFADGVDNDTTYSAGTGLSLSGANAFKVNFGGSGSSDSAARSDHMHYGQSWSGSAVQGLVVETFDSSVESSGLMGVQGTFVSGIALPAGVRGLSENGFGIIGEGGPLGGVYGTGDQEGVAGYARITSGVADGVFGTARSTEGTGVRGHAFANSGNTAGVVGEADSPDGIGVRGQNLLATGVRGDGRIGVAGYGLTNFSGLLTTGVYGEGINYGVHGRAIEDPFNPTAALVGVFGEGEVGVRGEGTRNSVFLSGSVGVSGSGGTGVQGVSTDSTGAGAALEAVGARTGVALRIATGSIQITGAGVGTSTPLFIHRATAANITGAFHQATTITHPFSDGNPDAILLITHNYSKDTSTVEPNETHPVAVFYDGSHWNIFHEDHVAMPEGRAFNVMVVQP